MHRILAFALVVSMAGTPAVFAAGAAQSPANSSMSGAVKSSTGRMVASTTVRLRDLETGQIVAITTSDAAGQFSFLGLAAGSFTAEIVTAAGEITHDAFGHPEEMRASWRETRPLLYELEQQDVSATYLAFVDSQPVAAATAVFAEAGVMLLGGATLPQARGRGCYRALVQARWDDAVRRGTPALVVQAGQMSRPILERLGFSFVSQLRVLVDELD